MISKPISDDELANQTKVYHIYNLLVIDMITNQSLPIHYNPIYKRFEVHILSIFPHMFTKSEF